MDIYAVVKILAKEKKVSISKIERDLNMGNGTILGWKSSIPNAVNLNNVADYLGVTSQYILNKSKEYTHE